MNDSTQDDRNIWSRIAAPLPAGSIAWRQDGKPTPRDGKYFARFVAYIEANTVRERLDTVVAGEWDLTLELLPAQAGVDTDTAISFKARMQILGVIREDVGSGKDYKQGSTDAFKRAAVRFGIAHELYAMEQNWVQVDGDGKYAKPLEDPQVAYDRRYGPNSSSPAPRPSAAPAAAPAAREEQTGAPWEMKNGGAINVGSPAEVPTSSNPACPVCGDRMWDNREGKRNPKAPDFKCRDRTCEGVIWPPKAGGKPAPKSNVKQPVTAGGRLPFEDDSTDDGPPFPTDDDIPY